MNNRTKQNKYKPQGEETRNRIVEYLLENQVLISPVSLREITKKLGMSLNTIYIHMGILEDQGRIRRNGNSRHIEILEKPNKLSATQIKDKALLKHMKVLEIRDAAKVLLNSHKRQSKNEKMWMTVSLLKRDESLDLLEKLFTEYEALK